MPQSGQTLAQTGFEPSTSQNQPSSCTVPVNSVSCAVNGVMIGLRWTVTWPLVSWPSIKSHFACKHNMSQICNSVEKQTAVDCTADLLVSIVTDYCQLLLTITTRYSTTDQLLPIFIDSCHFLLIVIATPLFMSSTRGCFFILCLTFWHRNLVFKI
jgi:hypothetical protein